LFLEHDVVETMHVKGNKHPLCFSILQAMCLASFMHNVAATNNSAINFPLSLHPHAA